EAWIVAQEYVQLDGDDEDETAPTLAQYAAALQSIFQFSNTDAIAASVETFHRTAIYVLQEKSTFLAVEAQIDEFSVHLEQSQYHSILSFLSLLSFRQRQLRYAHLRPIVSIHANPKAWWHFCIEATVTDARKRLQKIDWAYVRKKRNQQSRYVQLYILIHSQQTSQLGEQCLEEFDSLEYEMENEDILTCRAQAKKQLKSLEIHQAPNSGSYFSYSYWFGSRNPSQSTTEQETEYFYDAINYDPNEKIPPPEKESRIKYRIQVVLQQFSVELAYESQSLVALCGTGMSLNHLSRKESMEFIMEISNFELLEPTQMCSLTRLSMDVVMQNPEALQMSGARLRLCENQLPLVSCKVEMPPIGEELADLGIILISQPMQVSLDIPFVLSLTSFFKKPTSIDLSDIDAAAWERAKTFTKFSAAQLRQAIASRTKLKLNVDVTSPVIVLTENSARENPVEMTIYFGHLRAISQLQSSLNMYEHEQSKSEFLAKLPEEQLHDQLKLIIRGAQIGLNDEMPMIERTNMSCVLKTSVAPDDPTIALMKLSGDMEALDLHVSTSGYMKLRQLLASISENVIDSFSSLPQTKWENDQEDKLPEVDKEQLDMVDFVKLANRVQLSSHFSLQSASISLYEETSRPLSSVKFTNLASSIIFRNFDKRFEFVLGSIAVEDHFHNALLVSSVKEQSLIQLSITMISADRPSVLNGSDAMWDRVRYPQEFSKPLWKDIMHHPLSIDIALDELTIEYHRDTLSRIIYFFCQPAEVESSMAKISEGVSINSMASVEYNDSNSNGWPSSPFVTALIVNVNTKPDVENEWLQLQMCFKSLKVVLKTENNETLAHCSANSFYFYLQKSRRMSIAMSLETLLLRDNVDRDMVYCGAVTKGYDSQNELKGAENIHNEAAMFTLAYQSYGIEDFEESWHPGYSSSVSFRMHAPRICVVYRFVTDIQTYFTTGPIMNTIDELWPTQTGIDSGLVEPDTLTNVSTFPLLNICLVDTMLEMPRQSTAQESLVIRVDIFMLENGSNCVVETSDPLSKVIMNSRLRSLHLILNGLRIVTSMNDTLSLLGGTNINMDLDLGDMKFHLESHPIRFVCSKEQYGFLLEAPLSNLSEESVFFSPLESCR
ncbi:hypothetical protein As57867_004319, partial [Aphanomyces stellatus]